MTSADTSASAFAALPVLRKISELLILNSEAVPASLNGSSSAEEPQTQDGSGTLTEEQARRGLREAVKLAEFDISKVHIPPKLCRRSIR